VGAISRFGPQSLAPSAIAEPRSCRRRQGSRDGRFVRTAGSLVVRPLLTTLAQGLDRQTGHMVGRMHALAAPGSGAGPYGHGDCPDESVSRLPGHDHRPPRGPVASEWGALLRGDHGCIPLHCHPPTTWSAGRLQRRRSLVWSPKGSTSRTWWTPCRTQREDLMMVHLPGRPDGRSEVDETVDHQVGFPLVTGSRLWLRPVNHLLPAWDCIGGQMSMVGSLAAERRRRLKTGRANSYGWHRTTWPWQCSGICGRSPE